jgi:hypothetical protein
LDELSNELTSAGFKNLIQQATSLVKSGKSKNAMLHMWFSGWLSAIGTSVATICPQLDDETMKSYMCHPTPARRRFSLLLRNRIAVTNKVDWFENHQDPPSEQNGRWVLFRITCQQYGSAHFVLASKEEKKVVCDCSWWADMGLPCTQLISLFALGHLKLDLTCVCHSSYFEERPAVNRVLKHVSVAQPIAEAMGIEVFQQWNWAVLETYEPWKAMETAFFGNVWGRSTSVVAMDVDNDEGGEMQDEEINFVEIKKRLFGAVEKAKGNAEQMQVVRAAVVQLETMQARNARPSAYGVYANPAPARVGRRTRVKDPSEKGASSKG